MDPSWRQVYQSEDEDEALAKALERSRLEHEEKHSVSSSQFSYIGRSSSAVKAKKPKYEPKGPGGHFQGSVGGTAAGGIKAFQTGGKIAIPLCLPNNCRWDSKSREYVKTPERRQSLYVVQEALEQLRQIKGPVCVVSIAGPYRKGKSYALSQAFNQPQVFPLGHSMEAETMGIWLWLVPEKFKDSRGQEFTVVLLDSEGIDAVTGEGLDDNQIFTLTVLLASVLIYNSQGVPTRRDLEELKFIVKLSQCIEVRSKTGNVVAQAHGDSEFFHKTFPFFVWLLRDVGQEIPRDCENLKDYFLKKVFKAENSAAATQQGQKVAESILRFFSGFEAFMLPSPTVDPQILKSISDNKEQVNPKFFSGLEEFKRLLKSILAPKNSFNDGELVTGEGLAALVQHYVEAINSPGAIPNVQNAWDNFVGMKSYDAIKVAMETYESKMASQLQDKIPCGNDELRNAHQVAQETCERYFMKETAGICTKTTEQFLNQLKERLRQRLNAWQTKNARSTEEFCNDLLVQLKGSHVDPILVQLQGKKGAKLSFQDIIDGYNRIKEDYNKRATGASDVIAAVFFEFNIGMMKEQEQYLGLLRNLKDFDEALAQELAAKAYQEQERQKLEEQQERLRQENQAIKKEMELLSGKQREERQKFRKQMDKEIHDQRQQMNNMVEANMEQARQERQEFVQQNEDLRNQYLTLQRANEENLKMMKKLSDLVERQEEEKRRLREQRERDQAAKEIEELKKEMEVRHKKEQDKLRREMEQKMEAQCKQLAQEYQNAVDKSRMEQVQQVQQKLDVLATELEEVKKPGFIQTACTKVKEVFRAGVQTFKENCSLM